MRHLFAALAITATLLCASVPAASASTIDGGAVRANPGNPFGELQPAPGGPPLLNWVFVPSCLGLFQTACETLLQSRGLQRGTLSFLAPQSPPPYVGSAVVSQAPAAGTLVPRGAAVDVTLQPVSVPRRPN